MKYLALLAMFPFVAFATERPPLPAPKQDQRQEQHQAQSQSQEQANSQSVAFEDREQAPAVFAPSIAPTAPCYYSASGGLSVPGFGASGGKAIKDQGCEDREEARLWFSMGFVDQAVAILCKGQENCPLPNRKPEPVAPVQQPTTVVVLQGDSCASKPVDNEKVDRVVKDCAAK